MNRIQAERQSKFKTKERNATIMSLDSPSIKIV